MADFSVKGQVITTSNDPVAAVGDQKFIMNPLRHELVVNGLPGNAEIIRMGNSFYGTHGTAGASLNATIPTVTAVAALWNGEPAGVGKIYIVTGITAHCAASAAVATDVIGFACTSTLPLYALPGTEDTTAIRGLAAGKLYPGKAKLVKTVTVSASPNPASVWFPLPNPINDSVLSATVGFTFGGQLAEPIILPPGHYVGVASCAATTTCTWTYTFFWHEVALPAAI